MLIFVSWYSFEFQPMMLIFAWSWTCILCHAWLIQYWLTPLLIWITHNARWPLSVEGVLQGSQPSYQTRPVANQPNPAEVIHPTNCKPQIVPKVGHDDVIIWKHFPRNWPFVRGIHPWGWWFETPSWSLWRQCHGNGGFRRANSLAGITLIQHDYVQKWRKMRSVTNVFQEYMCMYRILKIYHHSHEWSDDLSPPPIT